MDKSYVTLEVCVICGKDTGALFLDRRLKNSFEMHTSFPNSVCDGCREKYLSKGVMLINPKNGKLVVIKDEAFKRIFKCKIPEGKIGYTDDELLEKLNRDANSSMEEENNEECK